MFYFDHDFDITGSPDQRMFLALDYFHDGWVDQISYDAAAESVTLRVSCERECMADNSGRTANNLTVENWPIEVHDLPPDAAMQDHHWQLYRFNPRYQYVLTFSGCAHFAQEDVVLPCEYITGQYKDSALLHRLQENSRGKLTHFRVQFANGGYIDVVFRRFEVKRLMGRFRISRKASSAASQSQFEEMPRDKVRAVASDGIRHVIKLGDKRTTFRSHREEALTFLASRRDCQTAAIAERHLRSRDIDLQIAAIHALGRCGSAKHLLSLSKLVRKADRPIEHRFIMDAIELIVERCK